MPPKHIIDLDPAVQKLLADGKAARVAAYNQCASLDRTLQVTFGLRLRDFAVPRSCTVRPLISG